MMDFYDIHQALGLGEHRCPLAGIELLYNWNSLEDIKEFFLPDITFGDMLRINIHTELVL